MATLMQRLQKFLHSPQGQRTIQKGQQQLAKPENQAKLRRIVNRLQGRRR